ncbi:bifunctional GNAT family N-acetyltransferase/carbon-nitrogen hydrolase family protein [Alkalitalea saponilacus]|uniref:Predicted amidohydrolase n=1 Tax=Alkalitalea saponilacus TaxID=889453 RepID=A0A1T5CCY0_9BACT|nr:bifunctional GNAT family N-acetyltransferase/carbon-nitrogen hydrolase family protein [Alkalitalea saponilacus]ASB49818.1 carbon-nitrogen hydrolase [Alkalitalea saponilacus]SKB57279.1 Predicted amidohydrolase [Alkalitalea saponilacus]
MTDIKNVELRNLNIDDYEELKAAMLKAYSNWQESYWREHEIRTLLNIFPMGQLAVLVDGVIVGCALSICVKYELFGDEHSYKEITGNYTFTTHNPRGDVLYGIDMFIHPEFRGLRLGRRLYDARKELCEQLNLKAVVFGGRIPEYHIHASKMTPREYIQKVKDKELFDPTLTFQLSNDFHVKKVLTDYLPGDKESKEYAVLMQWDNIYYTKKTKELKQQKSVIRLGLVQWQMRHYATSEDMYEQIEYFVDAVSAYKSDFILFPEFFNAPLMAKYNHLSEPDAIRKMAEYTEDIRDRFIQLAISYNVNIITGSMPLIRDDKLFNVGYLCRRNGTFDSYEKIHVTPDEIKAWGLSGSNKLQVYETDCGKIGILICYDVEFPELPRILADQGMKILFVPFLTDTQNGYSRVRYCARARAIENECFVAIAGSVGNLPKVHNMNIQYAQSAVFTPCDFPFPTNGVKTEATPNTEMILVSDVDLDLLSELHTYGSVRNLKDRRTDVFDLKLKNG